MAFRQVVSRLRLVGFQSRSVVPAIQTSSVHTTNRQLIHDRYKYTDDENNVFKEYSWVERARPVMKEEMDKLKSREVGPGRTVALPIFILLIAYLFYCSRTMYTAPTFEAVGSDTINKDKE